METKEITQLKRLLFGRMLFFSGDNNGDFYANEGVNYQIDNVPLDHRAGFEKRRVLRLNLQNVNRFEYHKLDIPELGFKLITIEYG